MTDLDLDQLISQSATTKINAGAALSVVGVGSCLWLWEQGWIAGIAVLMAVLGPLLFWTGLQERAQDRLIESETQRATDEWESLASDLRAAKAAGRSPARELQQRGYEVYAVRRWILESLGYASRPE